MEIGTDDGSDGAGTMNFLRGALRLVLIALTVSFGRFPAARAQQDADGLLKQVRDDWKDGSPASRVKAIETLGSLGSRAAPALPMLVAALRDPSPIVRGKAATIMGGMGPAEDSALPLLTALLADPDESVRHAAAWALARLGSKARGSIAALVRSLRAPLDRRCPAAAAALACVGKPAVPALIDLLESDDPALCRTVLDGLCNAVQSGLWSRPQSVCHALEPRYSSLARDPDPAVRVALVKMWSATQSRSPMVIRSLTELLRSPDTGVRLAVLNAVQTSPYPSIVPDAVIFELLKDRDHVVRTMAARAIRQNELGKKEVVAGLMRALEDADADVRAAAAQKLAEAPWRQDTVDEQGRLVLWVAAGEAIRANPTARETLRAALNDSETRVRAAAARLLAAFSQDAERSIPMLIERLRDPAASVRSAAAESLAHFGVKSRDAVRPLLAILADPEERGQDGLLTSQNAARALLAIGGDARRKMLHLLLGQLNSLDDAVRQRAVQILAGLGSGVVEDLLRTFSNRRLPRQVHVEILGILNGMTAQLVASVRLSRSRPGAREAVPLVRSLARDGDPEVQRLALSLLAAIDPQADDAAEIYLDRLRRGEVPGLEEQRPAGFGLDPQDEWLGLVARPVMIPRLIKALREEDAEARLAVVRVLLSMVETPAETGQADLGDGARCQVAEALLDRLRDPDDRVSWFAVEALGVLHVEAKTVVPILNELAKIGTTPVRLDDGIRSFEEAGQPYVLGPNKKQGDPLRIAAIQALGSFGPEAAQAVPELIRALRDEDRRVRWFAAEALGLIGPDAESAVPALIEALRSDAVATGDAGDDGDAVKDGPVRLMAAFALGKVGPAARAVVPELIAALSGPDSRVRGAAAQTLGQMGPAAREAIPHLIRLVARDRETQGAEYAKGSINRLGADAGPALARALADAEPAVRLAAIEVLGELEDKAAVPVRELVRCLGDPDAQVRKAAAMIVQSSDDCAGAAAGIPRLVIALGDDDDDVSGAARKSLAAIVESDMPASLPILNAALARLVAMG
jgi:HEAT repeat protein